MLPTTTQKFSGKYKDVLPQMNACLQEMFEQITFIQNPEQNWSTGLSNLSNQQSKLVLALRDAKTEEKRQELNQEKDIIDKQIETLCVIEEFVMKIEEMEGEPSENQCEEDIQVFEQQMIIEETKDDSESMEREYFKRLMIYNQKLPECFEKVYIRILYLLSLLSESGSEDKILGIVTNELRFQKLQSDLAIVLTLFDKENINETLVEQQLKSTIAYFKNQNANGFNFKDQIGILFPLLTKNIIKFNFQEFFELVEESIKTSKRLHYENIVLLLGTTGAGKSTTIQYLCGAKMQKAKNGHIQGTNMSKELQSFVSSSAKRSITRNINSLELLAAKNKLGEKIFLVDTPGFGDTQGAEVDISNSLSIIRVAQSAKTVYPTFILSEKNSGSRCEIMKSIIESYSCMIKDISINIQSVNFFFSNIHNKELNMYEYMKSITQDLSLQEHYKQNLKDVLKAMEQKGLHGQLLILDPLDKNPQRVLQQIINTPAISEPKNVFSLSLVPNSKSLLDAQLNLHSRSILTAVSNGDIDLVNLKLQELSKLAEIFEEYDKYYKNRLPQIIEQILESVKQNIDPAIDHIQRQMSPGNQLDQQDIEKFLKAIAFQEKLSPFIEILRKAGSDSERMKNFCDQYLPPIITCVTSECSNILTQKIIQKEINDEEWVLFIQKVSLLASNVKDFVNFEKIAIDKFLQKYQDLAVMSQNLIKKTTIDQYRDLAQSQPNFQRGMSRKQFQSYFQNQNQEELKTSSIITQIITPIDEDEARTSQLNQQQSIFERIVSTKNLNHEKFGNYVNFLQESLQKFRTAIENPQFIEKMSQIFDKVSNSLQNLDKLMEPFFQFNTRDKRSPKQITVDEIINVNIAFTMMEQFAIVCKSIEPMKAITTQIIKKYINLCSDVFFDHHKYLFDIVDKQEINAFTAKEVNERFAQILILRQVSYIDTETNSPYLQLVSKFEAKIEKSKWEVNHFLQDFRIDIETPLKQNQNFNDQLKRLKEALQSIIILERTVSDNDDFFKKVMLNILLNFKNLLLKLQFEGDQQYMSEDNLQGVKSVAIIYEQAQEIEKLYQLISQEREVQLNTGLNWLESIKDIFIKIQDQAEKLKDKMMQIKDYQRNQISTAFLRLFTENSAHSSLRLVLQNVQIEPRKILQSYKNILTNQVSCLKTAFDQAIKQLKELTNPKLEGFEEFKGEGDTQIEQDITKVGKDIIALFKLVSNLKKTYSSILIQILDEENESDEDYFLKYFSSQIKLQFFDSLDKRKISGVKDRLLIYFKLIATKELLELDHYLFPSSQNIVNAIYDGLNDKYYLNPEVENEKAIKYFQEGMYEEVKNQIDILKKPPVNDNTRIIIQNISEYITKQARSMYDVMSKLLNDHETSFDQVKLRSILNYTGKLCSINQTFGNDIRIQGTNIIQLIENNVFGFLQIGFKHLLNNVEDEMKRYNFREAEQKIEEHKILTRIITNEAGIELNQIQAYKELQTKLNNQKEQIIVQLKTQINDICDNISQRDIQNIQHPAARIIYEKLENLKLPEVEQIRMDFLQKLIQKYNQECNKIEAKIEQSKQPQSPDKSNSIKRESDIIIDTLKNMPNEVHNSIKTKIDNLLQTHNEEIQTKISQYDREVSLAISKSADPQILSSHLMKYSQNQIPINQNLKREIEDYVDKKYCGIISLASEHLDQNRVQPVIEICIPQIMEYLEDQEIQNYLKYESQDKLIKLQDRIRNMYYESIEEISKYFQVSHQVSGEFKLNQQSSEAIKLPNWEKSLAIISGIFSCINSKKNCIESFIKNLEQKFSDLLQLCTSFLRKMKGSFHNGINQKLVKEVVSTISNMKYTNIVLNEQFKQFLTKNHGICEQQCQEFNLEVQQVTLKEMQNQTILWLETIKNSILNQTKFVDPLRSESECSEFYKEMNQKYEMLNQAQLIENLSPLKQQNSRISQLKEEAYMYFENQINDVIQQLNKIKSEIDDMSPENLEEFGIKYKSLISINLHIIVEKKRVEETIQQAKELISKKLSKMIKKAKEYYADQNQINFKCISIILCEIQMMKENLTLFQAEISQSQDKILEDFQKISLDPQSDVNLQSALLAMPNSYGPTIAKNHKAFKGVNILVTNKKFQSKKIEQVKQLIQGTDLSQTEADQLEKFYNQIMLVYSQIVSNALEPKTDRNNKVIPMDLSSIKSNIKSQFSSQKSKKWDDNSIFKEISWGKPSQEYYISSILIAHIFALWTLLSSDHYKNAEQNKQTSASLSNYLLQPHVAQILSILRILGVGYSSQNNIGNKFNQFWKNVFGASSLIRNNLVQIKTGEGKSVTLAVIAIIFALNGFEVNCACYSKYLSQRDYESFLALFRFLDIQDMIIYGTFNEIAEQQINKERDVRELFTSLVLKDQFQAPKQNRQKITNKNPQVLLIDEVDVFFSKDFFGETYTPQALIRHEAISELIDYIWKQNILEKELKSQMSLQEKEKNKDKISYMSVKKIKLTQEYQNALNLFKPEYQFLVEEAVKKMVVDVVEYEKNIFKCVMFNGQIGYKDQDQILTNMRIGYQTLFTYYFKNQQNEVSDQTLLQQKAIGIDCATFSYAEVPLEYSIILGVSGTLETLSNPQKEVISTIYQINHFTFSPSVYSSDESRIFNRSEDLKIIFDPLEYYMSLVNEMEVKYLSYKRPVIVFFSDNDQLNKFKDCEEFKRYKPQILNEKDSNSEKESKVLKATQARQITLATKNFGRGTDFCCYDQEVISNGGLVVFQTFLSEDLSEETQIRGRTGRQGQSGRYILYLNFSDLSKFNIENPEDIQNGDRYKLLCDFRNQTMENKQNELNKNRNEQKMKHDESKKMIELAKNAAKLQQHQLKELTDYQLELNKGISLESNQQAMKVLVLIDCTGSMGITLQKTKNCVSALLDEAKQALREEGLSEDLILMKVAGYRNYSSLEEKIFQASPEWTSNNNSITGFLNSTLQNHGGQGNEALEIGLQYANKEIIDNQGILLSMIIIIGDAKPNTINDVKEKRLKAAQELKNPKYWENTKDYKQPTHWEQEIKSIEEAKVPVHSFYVLNAQIQETSEQEKIKESLHKEFKKLSVNDGKCAFLDIHNEEGQKYLKDFFKYLIVYRATEINKGKEAALQSVKNIKVSFT